MTLYLQKDTNGTFTIAEKIHDYLLDCDYYSSLIENIPASSYYITLLEKVISEYGCKKLVLDF